MKFQAAQKVFFQCWTSKRFYSQAAYNRHGQQLVSCYEVCFVEGRSNHILMRVEYYVISLRRLQGWLALTQNLLISADDTFVIPSVVISNWLCGFKWKARSESSTTYSQSRACIITMAVLLIKSKIAWMAWNKLGVEVRLQSGMQRYQ